CLTSKACCSGPHPAQLGDTRIIRKCITIKSDAEFRRFTNCLDSSFAEMDAPCLLIDRLALGEDLTSEQGEVYSPFGIANRLVTNNLNFSSTGDICETLAVIVICGVCPSCPVE